MRIRLMTVVLLWPIASAICGSRGLLAQTADPLPPPPGSISLEVADEPRVATNLAPANSPPLPSTQPGLTNAPAPLPPFPIVSKPLSTGPRAFIAPTPQGGHGTQASVKRLKNPFEWDESSPIIPRHFTPASPQTPASRAYPTPQGKVAGRSPGSGSESRAPTGMAGSTTPGAAGEAGQNASPGAAGGSVPSSLGGAVGGADAGAGALAAENAFAAAAGAAGPGFGGGLGNSGGGDLPPMIGDQSPFRFQMAGAQPAKGTNGNPGPPPPPGPRTSSLFYPSVRNFKISENMSPRPQDRVFYNFNYYDNLNATLNKRFQVPITSIKGYRNVWGFEKTFNDGNGSFGIRVPLNTVTANSTSPSIKTPTSTAMGDMTIFGKYILEQNKKTGSLVSVGLAITPRTGPGRFAGAPYLFGLNTTYVQPYIGFIWNKGRFYLQGFSAFDFAVSTNDVSLMYNDIGMGYFIYRSKDNQSFLTALAPTFELHVNSPLNHRDVFNRLDFAGTPDVVNLTYGLNCEFRRQSILTFAVVTPVSSPRPFDIEYSLLFNWYFGRSRANPFNVQPPLL